MGTRLHRGLEDAFADHPNVGDIRGGKGLMAAVEIVRDRSTKENFGAHRKIGPLVQVEMMKRGVVTRVRATPGPHPMPGDMVLFAPPLVITEPEIDRFVGVAREAVDAVLGTK
jgi:adenosylmethionine-8-amino-7-oxononanoate aminotransferase